MENEEIKKVGWKGLSFTQKIVYSIGLIVVMLFILGVIVKLSKNSDISGNSINNAANIKEETFVINGLYQWTSCYNESRNLFVDYELSTDSPIDIIFTPTQKDASDFNESSLQYPSCYIPNTISNKGSCTIAGNGCLLLLNKISNSATVTLRYSVK